MVSNVYGRDTYLQCQLWVCTVGLEWVIKYDNRELVDRLVDLILASAIIRYKNIFQ